MPARQPTRITVPAALAAVTTTDHTTEVPGPKAGLAAEDVTAVWQAVQALYRTGVYPGVAFCLRRRGQIVLNRTLGHASGNGPLDAADTPKRLLAPDTPICLFSASKAVVATLVHLLADQGEIVLDSRVSRYLPAFAQAGKAATTIADVLAHRGGFPTLPAADLVAPEALLNDWPRVVDLICAAPPTQNGRSAYHALTAGFVLGEIIQRVTGETLSAFMTQQLRRPLGMRHFTYGLPKAQRAHAAQNYVAGAPVRFPFSAIVERALHLPFADVVRVSNSAAFQQAVIPAGNLYATAEELSRFYQMLLDGGVYGGRRILTAAAVARLVRPVGRVSLDRTLMIPMRYSEGLMLGARPFGLFGPNTAQAYGHLGFMNILGWADPQREIAAALLTTGKAVMGSHLVALSSLLSTLAKRCI